MSGVNPPPPPPMTAPSAPTRGTRKKVRKLPWVIGAAAALVGFGAGVGVGVAASQTDPKTTGEYKAVARKLDDATARVTGLTSRLQSAKDQLTTALGTIPSREAALKSGESKLRSDEAALKQEQASVRRRERAVGIVERTIARNTISGDGIYQVGTDIKPGQYKTKGGAECYYAVLNSSDTNDIVDNNNVSGPAIVDVRAGQYLELSGCNDFVWQR